MDQIKLKNKKILVTGGCGYLGEKLITELLTYESEIYAIDIKEKKLTTKNLHYQKINLLNLEELSEFIEFTKPDIIFHLAANLNRSRDFSKVNDIFDSNLKGTLNLLNSLKNCNYENLIFTSTSEIYGGESTEIPFRENTNFIPASPYSLSKYCAEMSIKTFSNIYSRNYTILRLFNFFSIDMPQTFFLSSLIEKLKLNEDFDMTQGEQIRDYIHVNDIIKALTFSTSKKAFNQVFNVCSGEGKSIKDLALEIKAHLKSNSKINFGALPYRKNEVWNMTGDNSKIKKILKWEPSFELMENL